MPQSPMSLPLTPHLTAIFLLSGCGENGQSRVESHRRIREKFLLRHIAKPTIINRDFYAVSGRNYVFFCYRTEVARNQTLSACLRRDYARQATDHQVDPGHADERRAGLDSVRSIVRDSTGAAQPGDGSRHAPPRGQEQESRGFLRSRDPHQTDMPPRLPSPPPGAEVPGIGLLGPDYAPAGPGHPHGRGPLAAGTTTARRRPPGSTRRGR
jgi:hypothetical protein